MISLNHFTGRSTSSKVRLSSKNRVATPQEARTDLARKLRLRSGEPSAYAAFLGSVPGEETDEAFAAAVEESS